MVHISDISFHIYGKIAGMFSQIEHSRTKGTDA